MEDIENSFEQNGEKVPLLQQVQTDVQVIEEKTVNRKYQNPYSSTEEETSILIHTDEKGKSKLVDQNKYRSKTVDSKVEKSYGYRRNSGVKKI